MIGAGTNSWLALWVVAGVLAAATVGCSVQKAEPAALSPYSRTVTIAVAPALNHSGSSDFDPMVVADLFASELSHVDEVVVIPLSRTLAVLASQGKRQIESPSHALEVCEALGAEAIVVMAVTEYDPYDPPVVGITAQMYALAHVPSTRLDPVAISRRPSPFAVAGSGGSALQPRSQTQRVFNASHETVAEAVRRYAWQRDSDRSPYGWRKWMKSQRQYLRFCCWATVEELMRQELERQPLARAS